MMMKPKTNFKWYYCVIIGLATIIDGLTMILTLGWFSTNLSLKFSLWGASRKIYRSVGSTPPTAPSPEHRFKELIEGYGMDEDNERYPDRLFIYDKHGNYLFEYDKKNGRCWTSYYNVWSIFEEEYGYNYDEIKELLKGMVEKHFNWMGVTPERIIYQL